MASDFASMFLQRKRSEQGRGSDLGTTPAPSPYERYGLSGERPLASGKYTGHGEDGTIQPSMPTERRVAINGKPYAVDEGEVVVINADTVKAYGGPESLDKFIQSHRPGSNYQELGPDDNTRNPTNYRIGGQAPAFMMNQMSVGGVPSGMRPYESQYSILSDIMGGQIPRMQAGGNLGNLPPTTKPIGVPGDVWNNIRNNMTAVPSATTAQSATGIPSALPGSTGYNAIISGTKVQDPGVVNPLLTAATTGTAYNATPATMTPEVFDTWRLQAQKIPQLPAVGSNEPSRSVPVRMDMPTMPGIPEIPGISGIGKPFGTAGGGAPTPTPATTPQAPVLSPSQLDQMILDQYLTRMGGMTESERAAEEQRLMQQGVSPEAIRGQVAISDVSRRSALGQAASQYATGEAQRAQQAEIANRNFEEQRRANMPIEIANDAKIMSWEQWHSKYPQMKPEDYAVATGQALTPKSKYDLWAQDLQNIVNAEGVTQKQIDDKWATGLSDPTLAPYLQYVTKPIAGQVSGTASTYDAIADKMIAQGGSYYSQYSDNPAQLKADMVSFIGDLFSSGGSIDPDTGLPTNPKNITLPWQDPLKFIKYTNWDGSDIVGQSDPNKVYNINGQNVTGQQLNDWYGSLTTAQKIDLANKNTVNGELDVAGIANSYGATGASSKVPTDPLKFGAWFDDKSNTTAQNAFKQFYDSAVVEGLPIYDKDGNKMDPTMLAGNENIKWIWGQLVNKINNGDVSKGLTSASLTGRSFRMDDQGNITELSNNLDPETLTSYDSPEYKGFAMNPKIQKGYQNKTHTINDVWVVDAFEGQIGKYVSVQNPVTQNWRVFKVDSEDRLDDVKSYFITDPVTKEKYHVGVSINERHQDNVYGMPEF